MNLPTTQKLFFFVGIIFSSFCFNFSAQAQITASADCGASTNVTPFFGTTSIFQIDVTVPNSTYSCLYRIYENGNLLKCNEITNNTSLGCRADNGNFILPDNGWGQPDVIHSFYLDTRKTPYVLSTTAPTDNSLDILQAPANFVTPGAPVTFTADPVILDNSGIPATFTWYRNGVEIPGQTGKTLTEIPPHNGTTYSVKAGTLQSETKTVFFTTAANDGVVQIPPGQDRPTYQTLAIDECQSIYRLDLTTSNAHYIRFALLVNGVQLQSINTGDTGLTLSDGELYRNLSDVRNLTYYLNMRTTPYELTTYMPYMDPAWLKVTLTADRNIINAAGDPVQLTAEVCPAGTYTYEWYENGVLMPGKSGDVITVNPGKNGTDYTVVVNGVTSNEEIILFADACDNRFSTEEWYHPVTITDACAIDECHAVYRLKLHVQKDAHFPIFLDGVPIDATILDIPGLRQEAGEGTTPGFRYTPEGNAVIECFLDMRNNAYNTLSIARPARSVPFVLATAVGGSAIVKCVPVTLEACPTDFATYQWYKKTTGGTFQAIPAADKGNEATLPDYDAVAGDEFYVVVNEGTPEELKSNTIVISYKPADQIPNVSINVPNPSMELDGGSLGYEAEIEEGGANTITITLPMDPKFEYTFQYKSLVPGSEWQDDASVVGVLNGANLVFTYNPTISAEYRIKAILAGATGACIVEHYSQVFLVRFVYKCLSGTPTYLFKEDFGRFTAENRYEHNGVAYNGYVPGTDLNGHVNNVITNWWAPEAPIAGKYSVRNHYYRLANDPRLSDQYCDGGSLLPTGLECWCDAKGTRPPKIEANGMFYTPRISDGSYAIVRNTESFDCNNGDYWQGEDHTDGDVNGGMLFINVGADRDVIIYERMINFGENCSGVNVLFSAFISNAAIKGEVPVNVRLDIREVNPDGSPGALVDSISSGNIINRRTATAANRWSNLSFRFTANQSQYYIQLRNYSATGADQDAKKSGNDLLLDDISVQYCIPEINLNSPRTTANQTETIGVCIDEDEVILETKLSDGFIIANLFDTYVYRFQYTKDTTGTWEDWTGLIEYSASGDATIKVPLSHLDDTFSDTTYWRVMVAATEDIITEVINNPSMQPTCEKMFLKWSNMRMIDYDYEEYANVDEPICVSEEYEFINPIPVRGSYEWYRADVNGNPVGAPLPESGNWTEAKPDFIHSIPSPAVNITEKYVFRPISRQGCPFTDVVVAITGKDCQDLFITKQADAATINIGESITYTITVENKSNVEISNIHVSDLLPVYLNTIMSNNASQGTYTPATGIWNIGTLAAFGGTAELIIVVRNTGGGDSEIPNYAHISQRTKEGITGNWTLEEAIDEFGLADSAKVYVNPGQDSEIIGEQPCKGDEKTYRLNTSLIQPPVTDNRRCEWSIVPANSGARFTSALTDTTTVVTIKYATAPTAPTAPYTIQCKVYPDYVLLPNIFSEQSVEIHVTDVPNVSISGEMHVCYGDIEKYTVLNDNTPNATYLWKLLSDENELIIDGVNSQTATMEWLPRNGAFATDAVQVEVVNTTQWASCTNSDFFPVSIHPNPPAQFSYDGSSTMYFQSEPSYRHTDSIYTNIPVKFINESHNVASVVNVEYYWDFTGNGVFTQTSYDGMHTYHDAGNYTVQLHAVDTMWGCRTQVDTPLVVLPNPNCIASFPNAFTPAKTTNNVFGALYTNGVMLEGFELRVFDRWGTMVWSTNDPYEYWNGTFRGEIGKQDVYVYHCKAVCQDIDPKTGNRKTLSIKGDVTLIR